MKKLLVILIAILFLASPVYAGEDYHDGDTQQTHVWIQEGDARFCYWNTMRRNTDMRSSLRATAGRLRLRKRFSKNRRLPFKIERWARWL